MKLLDASKILKSRDRPWFDVFRIDLPRGEFEQWLGVPPTVDWVDGLGEADYWYMEFECSLAIGFEFLHDYEFGHAVATEPNFQHASRHMRKWISCITEFPEEAFALDRNAMNELFANSVPELRHQKSYQLWRQGDDGNPMPVQYPTSLLDATCLKAELESHFHKQLYWIE